MAWLCGLRQVKVTVKIPVSRDIKSSRQEKEIRRQVLDEAR